MGKLLVIEGTDCSGKETQTKLLVKKLENDGKKVMRFSFPNYDSPTGKIIGGPYLGKPSICNTWFDNPLAVDPKITCLYYAADRKYNIDIVNKYLNEDYIVILDRYVPSNMAHQGSKIENKEERQQLFRWIEKLEYELLELPKPDKTIFLYMPIECAETLKKNRNEIDAHEKDKVYLNKSVETYFELASIYNYDIVHCVKNNEIRSIEDINNEIYDIIK